MGSRRNAAVLPAVARSLPREVDPLSQLGLQDCADDIRDYVYALGYLGLQPATGTVPTLSLVFTILYFAFFLFMPFYTRIEKTKPVPTRVTW